MTNFAYERHRISRPMRIEAPIPMKYAFCFLKKIKKILVLMPRWETALLPWDLLCSPGTIAWGGDGIATDIATTRPKRPKGPFGEK